VVPIAALLGVGIHLLRQRLESKHNRVGTLVFLGRVVASSTAFFVSRPQPAWLDVALFFLVWWPGLWLPWLVLPLGFPRLTYALARLTFPFSYWCEPLGGATFLAALTARDRRRARALDWEFVERKLDQVQRAHGGATIAAHALLAVERGDADLARQLFLLVVRLHYRHAAYLPRRVAAEWLTADAISRHQGPHVLPWLRTPRFVWFLRGAERRARLGPAGASAAWLTSLFLMAPHRRKSRAILRQALSTRTAPPSAALVTVAESWDKAFASEALAERVARRLAELGGNVENQSVLGELREGVIVELVQHLESKPVAIKRPVGILAEALDRVRDRWLEDIEERIRTLTEPVEGVRAEAPLLCAQWSALRASVARLLELDPAARTLVYHLCYPDMLNWAADLCNVSHQGMLAHDVFHFMHTLGGHHAEAETLRLLKGNLKLTL
jgi:hypothetical protein